MLLLLLLLLLLNGRLTFRLAVQTLASNDGINKQSVSMTRDLLARLYLVGVQHSARLTRASGVKKRVITD